VAGATFFLLIAGGLVTSTGSGLAVPDWPLSFGMLFPPMVGGIFFEHGHRMVAGTVGILMLILTVWLNRREPRDWVRNLGYGAMGTIVAQAILGGLTVRLLLPPAVSVAHACLAQAFFCLTIAIALVTSPRWDSGRPAASAPETPALLPHESPSVDSRLLIARAGSSLLALFALGAVFAQLVVGAVMRHLDAGVAIPDMSLGFGGWPQTGNAQLALHAAHRIWALVVTALTVGLGVKVLRTPGDREGLDTPARTLLLLLPLQLALGILTVVTQKHAAIATAHLAVGALVLGATLILAIRLGCLPRIAGASAPFFIPPATPESIPGGIEVPPSSTPSTPISSLPTYAPESPSGRLRRHPDPQEPPPVVVES
jgi:cytochrome c oxidase assembly protein subunit 15